jgi:NAD(P)-dependent dehydrogenase (short-subunit alcohol dehydrogenase family)
VTTAQSPGVALADADFSRGFQGRAYIVTGAASGIGRDAVLGLSALGANVVAVDRDESGLEQLARLSESIAIVSGDCTRQEIVDRCLAESGHRFGSIDGLVSNVGIAVIGRIEELSIEEWSASLGVNLSSHFLMTRSVMRQITEQGTGGSLVYIASKNAYSPGAGFGAYSVAKAGLVQLARLAAIEGAAAGIRANVVSPDNVFAGSHLWSAEVREMRAREHGVHPDNLEEFYRQRNLLQARVEPADVTRAIAFFLSDWSAKTTGCVLTVDGGLPAVFPR